MYLTTFSIASILSQVHIIFWLRKMTKPLGYYTGYTPGDGGVLAKMEEAFGSQLEDLNQTEKAWMLQEIASSILEESTEVPDPQIAVWSEKVCQELCPHNKLGLAIALVESLKESLVPVVKSIAR